MCFISEAYKNMKKALFVFNPHSGKGQIKFNLLNIIDILTKGGYDVTVHPTQSKYDALDTVTQIGNDFDAIICSGGDGTLNETIEGIMSLEQRKPLGYIPAGTMNDFATSLNISKNMKQAALNILRNEKINVDVGSFNKVFFTYVAAFGAFTDVSYETPQQKKNVFGTLAYIMEGMKKLNKLKSYSVKLKYNDTETEGDFLFGMVSNSTSVAGFKGLSGNDVMLDDGVFECFLVKNPTNLMDFQMMINDLLQRKLDSPYFCFFKTNYVEFESSSELPWTLDGEFGGIETKVVIKNNHKAIEIFAAPNDNISEHTEVTQN